MAIIFQDDFEDDPSDWECTDGDLSKWSSGWGYCGSTVGFGPEFKMGTGRNGGNAVYVWKCDQVPNDYRAEANRWLTGGDLYADVYHRWYMKMPSTFNKAIASGFKFWRYLLRENGYSSPPEIYLNAQGDTLATGNLVVLLRSSEYLTLTPVSDFNDGQWHCHELRIKVNSNGQSDGIIEYWLDGTKKASHTDKSMSASVTDMKVHRIGVGIGNVSDSAWYMADWTACAFDDVVLSTTYVGPDGLLPGPANLRWRPA